MLRTRAAGRSYYPFEQLLHSWETSFPKIHTSTTTDSSEDCLTPLDTIKLVCHLLWQTPYKAAVPLAPLFGLWWSNIFWHARAPSWPMWRYSPCPSAQRCCHFTTTFNSATGRGVEPVHDIWSIYNSPWIIMSNYFKCDVKWKHKWTNLPSQSVRRVSFAC